MSTDPEEFVVTREGDTLPVVDVLTGRGFVTGKSGSGKSNTASVVVEGLLAAGHSLLIVDVDGEYWGLKERYGVLRAGATDDCDVRVDAGDAETLVDVAFAGTPVILDLSAYLRADDADDLLAAVLGHLFRRATERKQPFLVVVEEIHEFVPQQGGLDEVGELLLRVAKRGRKHGLGVAGLSQRPAAVDKDYITQCDWLVWHRLTWDNDTDVVRRLLGTDAADAVQEFDPGEAFLQTDWSETVRRVRFREKETFDAGTTPGTGTRESPSLVPVEEQVLARFDRDDDRTTAASTDSAASSDGGQPGAARGGAAADASPVGGPGEHTDGSNVAVETTVELASMIRYLIASVTRRVGRGLVRAENRVVDAIHRRLPSPAPREPSALSRGQVRWLVRVLLGLAVLGATIVLTTGGAT